MVALRDGLGYLHVSPLFIPFQTPYYSNLFFYLKFYSTNPRQRKQIVKYILSPLVSNKSHPLSVFFPYPPFLLLPPHSIAATATHYLHFGRRRD